MPIYWSGDVCIDHRWWPS